MPVETATVETLDYRHSPLPVRDDLAAAHRAPGRGWRRRANGGPGAVRIAIAEETARRRTAISAANARRRSRPTPRPARTQRRPICRDGLVDVIHRIRTDAERLTRRFYDTALAGGLSDAEYVETVGVMATVIAIDSFCDAMGLPRHALPAPVAGEPRRQRPAGVKAGLAWPPTLAPEDMTDAEAGMYDGLAAGTSIAPSPSSPRRLSGFSIWMRCIICRFAVARFRHRIPRTDPCPDRVSGGAGLGDQPVRLLNHQPRGAAPWSGRHTGDDYDLTAIVEEGGSGGGVAAAAALAAYADAFYEDGGFGAGTRFGPGARPAARGNRRRSPGRLRRACLPSSTPSSGSPTQPASRSRSRRPRCRRISATPLGIGRLSLHRRQVLRHSTGMVTR